MILLCAYVHIWLYKESINVNIIIHYFIIFEFTYVYEYYDYKYNDITYHILSKVKDIIVSCNKIICLVYKCLV